MSEVTCSHLTKVYRKGNLTAVHDLSLTIPDGEFLALCGPSGCGKSTLIRMIAGLEEITEGEVCIGDRLVNDIPPKDRDIAMVSQEYALYPHMTVYRNLSFGLETRKLPPDDIDRMVHKAAKLLELEPLLARKPKTLSGGQLQRVALGRAIVRDPEVFLLDEPLSNLDQKFRNNMRLQIMRLHRTLKTTFIYVTHDQMEAMTMADRIAVMKDGILQQVDTPEQIYNDPANLFTASFFGSPQMNILEGVLNEKDGSFYLKCNGYPLVFPSSPDQLPVLRSYTGKKVLLGIRPEDIACLSDDEANLPQDGSVFRAKVTDTLLTGSDLYLTLETGGGNMKVRCDSDCPLTSGSVSAFLISPDHLHLFDPENELAICHSKTQAAL